MKDNEVALFNEYSNLSDDDLYTIIAEGSVFSKAEIDLDSCAINDIAAFPSGVLLRGGPFFRTKIRQAKELVERTYETNKQAIIDACRNHSDELLDIVSTLLPLLPNAETQVAVALAILLVRNYRRSQE